jgi:hypothetical protein
MRTLVDFYSEIEALCANIATQKRLRAELRAVRSLVGNGLVDRRKLVSGNHANSSPTPFDWWEGPRDEEPELQSPDGSPAGRTIRYS